MRNLNDGIRPGTVRSNDGVTVDDGGAEGGDGFGGGDVRGEDVADELGVDWVGDDGAEGCMFEDEGLGSGDGEHGVWRGAGTGGDGGGEVVGNVGGGGDLGGFVGLGTFDTDRTSMATGTVVVVMVVMRMGVVSTGRGWVGVVSCCLGFLFEGFDTDGVEGAGGLHSGGLETGVWKLVDNCSKILFCAAG